METGEKESTYCEACSQRFEAVRERGVWVRYRTDVAGGVLPPGFYVRSDAYGDRHASNRVDALVTATEIMDRQQVDGVFDCPETDTRWLVDGYLDAHPGVAEAVEAERDSFFSRLSNW
ncbi:MAG: hypothetical protein J07HX64_01621 [halophilic archaeon J07HX64]|nr:MAG: hypothetical protein J07HX64_01621 [halophilic archaeon J07HX64]